MYIVNYNFIIKLNTKSNCRKKSIAGYCYCEDCSNCQDCKPGSNPNPPGGNYPGDNPNNNYPGGKPAKPVLNLHTIKLGYTFDSETGEEFFIEQ